VPSASRSAGVGTPEQPLAVAVVGRTAERKQAVSMPDEANSTSSRRGTARMSKSEPPSRAWIPPMTLESIEAPPPIPEVVTLKTSGQVPPEGA
jgi:hypothetical protein